MDTISPVYARIVLRELERNQIATDLLFAGSGLTREQLQHGGDIALADFQQILRVGHALSGNDRLGLMIGSHSQIMTLGEVGAAMAIAPTVRQGLQVAESFTRLHISYITAQVFSNLNGLTVQLSFHEDLGSTMRFHVESAAMLMQNYVEMLTGLPLERALFRLAIPEPVYVQSYSDFLHSPVEFDAAVSTIELPMEYLDQSSPYYNAGMWKHAQAQLSDHLKMLTAKEEQPYTLHLAGLLNSTAPPLPDLAAVAATLCMSERTLNRRLKNEGSSFRGLKTEALISRAKQYLTRTNNSVEAIAADLGYLDTANFRRAFRKSADCSPRAYRDKLVEASHATRDTK
jgi:AraC-like DNA-binding protein